ncbi:MAG: Sau3AI family type II restriction endonuclease [Bacilli bacterium]|jgi:DNA mismatch repair protein MutH
MEISKRYLSEKEILETAKQLVNKTLGQLGFDDFGNAANKGNIGSFIEENVFGYKPNNDNNPDFLDAGIELKVTPIKRNENGTFSSKERLVLNIIDYFEEAKATFETSSFYKKNKKLLICFYKYIKGIPETDFEFTAYDLYEFEKSLEYRTIMRDWEIIHSKIVTGKAHEISESDTTFLAACTKGANALTRRCQPHGIEEAKQRAYSFKTGFMTRLYREIIHRIGPYVPRFVSDDEWMADTLEESYKSKLSQYYGKSVPDLKNIFSLKFSSKDINFKIAQKMLGLTGKQSSTQEMLDSGIKLKTVRLNHNGIPHESMSFPTFEFEELINTTWEESDIRENFVDWKLMLFVFKDNEHGNPHFEKIVFWNIPNRIVDGPIKQTFEFCARLIANGEALYFDNHGRIKDHFPKEKRNSNDVCHVRPHANKAVNVFQLPLADKSTGKTAYTKQCFWFNKVFISETMLKGE